jgi:NifB/MoaA-like Fe-S oxidoreductase
MKRIVEQPLSPQYVSIHATDLKTRAYLLGVDESRADISQKLEFLLENDIELHAQVVLCPEINDGAILEKTLRDLAAHYPKVVSTAVVPVALTRYNTDTRLTRVTPEFCRRTIKDVEKLQREFRKTLGTTLALLGDEIYIKAGAEIPSRRHYGNYPQIEDGVGMVRSFLNAFEKLLIDGHTEAQRREAVGLARQFLKNVRTHPSARVPHERVNSSAPRSGRPDLFGTILTGEMFAPILGEQIGRYNRARGTRLSVMAVPNGYFGGDVSVAGLLSGRDLLSMKGKISGDFVIIPRVTIKSDEPIFIDGMPHEYLKSQFTVPVYDLDTKGLLDFLK